ncbi:MAG: hydrogenase maturation protease [Bacillota bacterium]
MARVRVAGAGNPVRGDDALGLVAVRHLASTRLGPDVSVVEATTDPLSLWLASVGYDYLILIDAVNGGQPPGTIYVFRPNGCDDLPGRLSTRGIDLLSHLKHAAGIGPDLVVVGMEPAFTGASTELSERVRQRIPDLVNRVVEVVRKVVGDDGDKGRL